MRPFLCLGCAVHCPCHSSWYMRLQSSASLSQLTSPVSSKAIERPTCSHAAPTTTRTSCPTGCSLDRLSKRSTLATTKGTPTARLHKDPNTPYNPFDHAKVPQIMPETGSIRQRPQEDCLAAFALCLSAITSTLQECSGLGVSWQCAGHNTTFHSSS